MKVNITKPESPLFCYYIIMYTNVVYICMRRNTLKSSCSTNAHIQSAAAICLPGGGDTARRSASSHHQPCVWCCCFVIWLLKYLQGIELIHLFYSAHPYIRMPCAYPFHRHRVSSLYIFYIVVFCRNPLYTRVYLRLIVYNNNKINIYQR